MLKDGILLEPETAPRAHVDRVWRRRNLLNRVKGWRGDAADLVARVGIPTIRTELRVTVLRNCKFDAQGRVVDYERAENLGVVGRRVITDTGVQFIANAHLNTTELETINYHDAGTGTNNEAVGDTALQTPWGGARVAGTQSSPSNGAYRSVATIPFTGTFAITEHGILSASSAGTLSDRTKFAAINVLNGDSIQFTYTVTYSSGG